MCSSQNLEIEDKEILAKGEDNAINGNGRILQLTVKNAERRQTDRSKNTYPFYCFPRTQVQIYRSALRA